MTVQLPNWLLSATLNEAERAVNCGRITPEQFDAYFAIWFYSVPRFADYFGWKHVRDINAELDGQQGNQE